MGIPQIGATGTYTLASPFTTDPSAVYRCDSVEGFAILRENGIDIFTEYYAPNGLTQEAFASDETAEAKIVGLISENGFPTLYVPSTYILSFPTLDNVPYSRVFVSFDLGLLPDNLDLETAIQAAQDAFSEVVGVQTQTKTHRLGIRDKVTAEQHRLLELNRQQSIQYRETPYAGLTRLSRQIQSKEDYIAMLEQTLVALSQ